MPTQIKTWQVTDGKLKPVDANLSDAGRRETQDLEKWIASYPSIVSPDVVLIGEQVPSRGGPVDLLAIDKQGNMVVIELKREKLPREALVQAIDYASDIAQWSAERIGEICTQHTGKSLEALLEESFPDIDLESIDINDVQRIFLVGFGIEESLERMVSWLSDNYDFSINAILLQYTKTSSGDELLTRTAIISETIEQLRTHKKRPFSTPRSDEPGSHPEEALRQRLSAYLSGNLWSAQRMRKVLFPVLLRQGKASREEIKDEFVKLGEAETSKQAGYFLALISNQIGMASNDYLRQVAGYEIDPERPWLKENYFIRPEYKALVEEVLGSLSPEPSRGS